MVTLEYTKLKISDYSEEELKELWREEYCDAEIFTFDGIRVKFYMDNFEHAFYESSKRNYIKKEASYGYKDCLSAIRVEKMLWIKDTLMDPDADLFVGYDKETGTYTKSRRVAVVKNNYVVIIRLNNNGTAKFITAYVADNSIEKIRKSPMWRNKKDAD
jgi:hypothetical protein